MDTTPSEEVGKLPGAKAGHAQVHVGPELFKDVTILAGQPFCNWYKQKSEDGGSPVVHQQIPFIQGNAEEKAPTGCSLEGGGG